MAVFAQDTTVSYTIKGAHGCSEQVTISPGSVTDVYIDSTDSDNPTVFLQPGEQYTFTVNPQGKGDWQPTDDDDNSSHPFTFTTTSTDSGDPDGELVASEAFTNTSPNNTESDFALNITVLLPAIWLNCTHTHITGVHGSGIIGVGGWNDPDGYVNSFAEYTANTRVTISVYNSTMPKVFRDANAKLWRVGFIQNVLRYPPGSTALGPDDRAVGTYFASRNNRTFLLALPLLDTLPDSEYVHPSINYPFYADYDDTRINKFISDLDTEYIQIYDNPSVHFPTVDLDPRSSEYGICNQLTGIEDSLSLRVWIATENVNDYGIIFHKTASWEYYNACNVGYSQTPSKIIPGAPYDPNKGFDAAFSDCTDSSDPDPDDTNSANNTDLEGNTIIIIDAPCSDDVPALNVFTP